MPRLRTNQILPHLPGSVPEPLRTRLHPMWQDDDAIRAFCDSNALDPAEWSGPLTAFRAVAKAYASSQEWTHPAGRQMAAAGIPMFYSALENREKRWKFYSKANRTLTPGQWQFIHNVEQRILKGDHR